MKKMVNNLIKAILLLGFIVVVNSLESEKLDTKKCRKRNGLFPKLGSLCKGYYRCTHWIPVEETCPVEQHFNAIKGWCDWKELYPCFEKPKSKECPRENGRFLKTGTNCKMYYDCCNGEPTEKKCPQDQLFDPSDGKCEWSELYTCVESLSTTETNPKTRSLSTMFKIFPSSTTTRLSTITPVQVSKSTSADTFSTGSLLYSSTSARSTLTNHHDFNSSSKTASEYSSSNIPSSTQIITSSTTPEETVSTSNTPGINTINARSSEAFLSSILTSNPDLLILSTETDYFTPETKIVETTSDKDLSTIKTPSIKDEIQTFTPIWEVTSPETLNILCPEPNGYFPHPSDKHKFVGCVDNLPYVLTCPHDLVYQHELRRCEYP